MSLIAYRACDRLDLESFSIPADTWDSMRREPLGTYRMYGTEWPAILKRSIRGLQFFSHSPGYEGTLPRPKSEEHYQAQISLVRGLRQAGYSAWVEKSGRDPSGQAWQADVFAISENQQYAFEVQISPQTLDEYEARTSRYMRSNVRCVWLVRAPTRIFALHKSLWHRYPELRESFVGAVEHLLVAPLKIDDNINSGMRAVIYPEKIPYQEIGLEEFSVGVMRGRISFLNNQWRWT